MFDFFVKSGHKVCQDYAYITDNIALISDGCSTGKDTDIGARLLVHSYLVKQNIRDAIRHANDLRKSLQLDPSSLCATLGILELKYNRMTNTNWIDISLWGDGICIIKLKEQLPCVVKVEYLVAPYYPIYQLYGHDDYLKQFGEPTWIETQSDPTTVIKTEKKSLGESIALTFEESEFDYILLSTDGLSSFTQDIIPELLEFKGLNGKFLERRFQSLFKRKWQNLTHFDDIGVIGYVPICEEQKNQN